MDKYRLLKNLNHRRGNLPAGHVGRGYFDKYENRYIIWFEKHSREFYFYPVFISDLESVEKIE